MIKTNRLWPGRHALQRNETMAYVKIDGFLCERCSHRWIPKQPGLPEPKVCPKCKSYHWNTPRMRPPKADPYRNDPAFARRVAPTGRTPTTAAR